jgi:hypothetical protein
MLFDEMKFKVRSNRISNKDEENKKKKKKRKRLIYKRTHICSSHSIVIWIDFN